MLARAMAASRGVQLGVQVMLTMVSIDATKDGCERGVVEVVVAGERKIVRSKSTCAKGACAKIAGARDLR